MQALTQPCQQCHKPMNGGVYRAAHVCPHCRFEHAGGKKNKRKVQLFAVANRPATADYAVDEVMPEAESYSSDTQDYTDDAEDYVANKRVADPESYSADAEETENYYEEEANNTAEADMAEAHTEEQVNNVIATEAEAKTAAIITREPEVTRKPAAARPPVAVRKSVAASEGVTLTTKPASEFEVLAVLEETSAECVLSIELTPDLFEGGKFIGAKSEKVLAALKQGKKNALAELRDIADDLGANMVTDIVVKNGLKMVDAKTANITVTVTGQAVAAEVTEDAVEI